VEFLLLFFYITPVHFIFTFLAIFLAVCSSHGASLIGVDALGMDQSPQNSAVIKSGFSTQNPAINAFEIKTKFGVTILYEHAEAQKDNYSIPLNFFSVPSLSMILPLGFLGTFGIGLEPKYFANNRLEFIDAELGANALYSARVGIYEFTPSYSIRLPSFLSDFAIGASYRIFFGNFNSSLERKSQDSWMANGITIAKKESGSFETVDDWWQNFGAGLHFHSKTTDYFISYFPSVQMQKNIKESTQYSNSYDLEAMEKTETFKLPERFASGVHFRFLQNKNLSFVYESQNFEEAGLAAQTQKAVSYFAEYKVTGTGLYYSPFFTKNNFGANFWFAEKYLKDVKEYGASLLSDLWIGYRGTSVGLALFGGYRLAKEPYWDEPFFGIKLNLTGVGDWGTSSRRK
jgi:long-chain fatty acid transport protein